jgi:hypothetical protein
MANWKLSWLCISSNVISAKCLQLELLLSSFLTESIPLNQKSLATQLSKSFIFDYQVVLMSCFGEVDDTWRHAHMVLVTWITRGDTPTCKHPLSPLPLLLLSYPTLLAPLYIGTGCRHPHSSHVLAATLPAPPCTRAVAGAPTSQCSDAHTEAAREGGPCSFAPPTVREVPLAPPPSSRPHTYAHHRLH